MMDFIWLMLLCAAYFAGGYLYAMRRMRKQAEDLIRAMLEKQPSAETVQTRTAIVLNHEIINGVHYFYKVDDHAFVCQGSSLQEAAAAYLKRESTHVGMFKNSADNKMYYFIDGKVIAGSDKIVTL